MDDIRPPHSAPAAPSRLEVKIDSPVVSARAFIEKAAAMIDLVNSVALAMRGGGGVAPNWIVRELRMGSAVLVVEHDAEDRAWDQQSISRAVSTAKTGLLQLARHDSPRPPFFTGTALQHAKRLSKPGRLPRAGSFHLVMGGARIEPSPHIAVRVDQIKAARLQSLGSVEGKLIDLSSRDGYSIAIVDRRTNSEIRCVFPESMKQQVRSLFDEQVRARGVLWSREDGVRVELELRFIQPMVGNESLPTAADVLGLLRQPRHAAK